MYTISSQFLEIVAFTGFVYIIILAYMGMKDMLVPRWAFIILFLLGVLGLVLNGMMLYFTFFVKLSI